MVIKAHNRHKIFLKEKRTFYKVGIVLVQLKKIKRMLTKHIGIQMKVKLR